jgi:hypothetical protein
MKTTCFGCGCFVIIFVLVPSLFMFIGGAISYHSERIKERTYVISQCRVIAKSTKAKTCYRTTYSGYGRIQISKFSSVYLHLSNYESNLIKHYKDFPKSLIDVI